MSNALRPLLLALALLILGGMAAFSQLWVHQKSRPAARAEHAEWTQRLNLLAMRSAQPLSQWTEMEWREAGLLLGGSLRPLGRDDSLASGEIVLNIQAEPGSPAAFAPAGGLALAARHTLLKRSFLWLLGGAFLALVIIALVPGRRIAAEDHRRRAMRHEINNVEHLARTTISQAEALESERQARHHSEETLHLQQVLLNRSLEEKVRLGRDLHDGLIQTLYATGLALEAARHQVTDNPAKATVLIERCIGTLNTAIKEVRHEIENLAPTQVRRGNFKNAIEAVLDLLDAKRTAIMDLRVPEDISMQIPAETQAELLQVVRESVSNALRHGGATQIEIRLATDDSRLCLGISDNGRGFSMDALEHRGHGLTNLQARAAAIAGDLRIDSTSENGTRIILTFPQTPHETT